MQISQSAFEQSTSELGVALLRVSTDRQFQVGESIETQQTKVDLVAGREAIEIARYFVEHYSGRKEDRDTITELLEFLQDNPQIRFVIIAHIDRLTRAGAEAYLYLRRQLARLNVQLLDTNGVIQRSINTLEHTGFAYDWSVRSPSQTAEIVLADQANNEVSNMLTRMIGQQIQLTQNGYQVRYPAYGYKNEKITTHDGKERYVIIPHEEQAHFVEKMFELAAEDTLSDKEICERINKMGYHSRAQKVRDSQTRRVIGQRGMKPLYPKQLRRNLERVIYCGIRCEKWTNWEPIKAEGTPIVSIDLFNRANRGKIVIIENEDGSFKIQRDVRNYRSHRHNPDFLLRHVVACPQCQKPLVASKSKNKLGNYYGYYHCSRNHPYFGVKKKEFEETVAKFLDKLVAKPAFLPALREVVREVWIEKNRADRKEREAIQSHLGELKTEQENILQTIHLAQSTIVRSKLEKRVEELEASIQSAQQIKAEKNLTEDQIEAYFQVAKKLMEHPKEFILKADTKEKLQKIWSFIFAQKPTYTQLADGTPVLTVIYRLLGSSELSKRHLAESLSLQWNTFESEIRQSQTLFKDLGFSKSDNQSPSLYSS